MRPLLLVLLTAITAQAVAASPVQVRDLRIWASPDSTRVVLDLSQPVRYELFTLSGPDRVVIDIERTSLDARGISMPEPSGLEMPRASREVRSRSMTTRSGPDSVNNS